MNAKQRSDLERIVTLMMAVAMFVIIGVLIGGTYQSMSKGKTDQTPNVEGTSRADE